MFGNFQPVFHSSFTGVKVYWYLCRFISYRMLQKGFCYEDFDCMQ